MSQDRNCRMSDLNRMRSEVMSRISSTDQLVHRATRNMDSLRNSMSQNRSAINGLSSQFGHMSRDVAANNRHLHRLDDSIYNLEQQQSLDRQRIAQSEASISQINQDIDFLEDKIRSLDSEIRTTNRNVERNRGMIAENQAAIRQLNQHVEVLQEETELAHERIDENDHHIKQLYEGVEQVNDRVDEIEERERQTRESQETDVSMQAQQAESILKGIDVEKVRKFDCQVEYDAVMDILENARQSSRRTEFLQAAKSQYQDAQVELTKLRRTVYEREREYLQHRRAFESAVEMLEQLIEEADTKEMRYFYNQEFSALQTRFENLQSALNTETFDRAGTFPVVIQNLRELTQQAQNLQGESSQLHEQLTQTYHAHLTRLDMMKKVLDVFYEVWNDKNFDVGTSYVVEEDPKSQLKVQTEREDKTNVTLWMDLDKTFQFSLTGYQNDRGIQPGERKMECEEDWEKFERELEAKHGLQTVVTERIDKPGQPNPNGGGKGPGWKQRTPVKKEEQSRREAHV
jgi:DNA repair exonuclease SbcCD ATPase subunit